jgi:hypothetical protein
MSKAKLTERDRFWLGHLEAIEREGVAAKAYAKRRRLSVHALYQAKKRLVKTGAWPLRCRRAAPAARFSEIRVAPTPTGPGCRLRLPGGAVVEWDATPDPAVLAAVVAQAASPR